MTEAHLSILSAGALNELHVISEDILWMKGFSTFTAALAYAVQQAWVVPEEVADLRPDMPHLCWGKYINVDTQAFISQGFKAGGNARTRAQTLGQ